MGVDLSIPAPPKTKYKFKKKSLWVECLQIIYVYTENILYPYKID